MATSGRFLAKEKIPGTALACNRLNNNAYFVHQAIYSITMKQYVLISLTTILKSVRHHPKRWLASFLISLSLPVVAIVGSYALVIKNQAYILDTNDVKATASKQVAVGIVLGSGITKDGKPFRELQSRLDGAADALQKGEITKLLLSGDNRFPGYDEPTAMKNYLVSQRHISADKLQSDYAGRSTYESCERAAKVFGLHKTIIFSAGSHLPRAIYLCREFGVEAYGVASVAEANNASRREAVARVKAVFNVYVYGENTILGPEVRL